jgi:hypothetical protein
VLRAPLADPERLPARQASCASRQADRARRRLHRRASAVPPRAVTLTCRHVSPRLSPGGPRAGAGLIGAPARSCLGGRHPHNPSRVTSAVARRTARGAGLIGAPARPCLGAVTGPRAAPPRWRASAVLPRGRHPHNPSRVTWAVRQADRARRRLVGAPARSCLGAVTTTTRHVSPRLSPGGPRAGAGFIGAPARPRLGAVTPTTRHVSPGLSPGGPRAAPASSARQRDPARRRCQPLRERPNTASSPPKPHATDLTPTLSTLPPACHLTSCPLLHQPRNYLPPQRFLTTPEPRHPNLARSLAHPFPFHPQLFLFFFLLLPIHFCIHLQFHSSFLPLHLPTPIQLPSSPPPMNYSLVSCSRPLDPVVGI